MNARNTKELEVLRTVDFDWVVLRPEVWVGTPYDCPALHDSIKNNILSELDRMTATPSGGTPLGTVVLGSAGSGKTHLLASIRREAVARAAGFVFVDMKAVRDFWETVALQYVSSLQQPYVDGKPQYRTILEGMLRVHFPDSGKASTIVERQATMSGAEKVSVMTNILDALRQTYPAEARQHQDVIRAMVLLNSEDHTIADVGYTWLEGLAIDDEAKKVFRFRRPRQEPSDIVNGLSWAMSLSGPTILALDQMDCIVTQHHLAGGWDAEEATDEQRTSRAIVVAIAGGLGDLVETCSRTAVVVSCLVDTWNILGEHGLDSSAHRFHTPPHDLMPVPNREIAQRIVEMRLKKACEKAGFKAPYPSWPFRPEEFSELEGMTPREILMWADKRRWALLRGEKQVEKGREDLDDQFEAFKPEANATELLSREAEEDELLEGMLQSACRCLLHENPLPDPLRDKVDTAVEIDFPGGRSYHILHARIRLIYRAENDRERHFCLRALQKTNPRAYQARLKAAMTASGIDRNLTFRNLMVVRTTPVPTGPKTQQLTKRFDDSGGMFAKPTEEDIRTLWAVCQMAKERDPQFNSWLQDHRPVSKLPFMQPVVDFLREDTPSAGPETRPPDDQGGGPRSEGNGSKGKKSAPDTATAVREPTPAGVSSRAQEPAAGMSQAALPVGFRLTDQDHKDPLTIPAGLLAKHVVVLAGSGSGKTVLVRRLVEEAALLGIPSIVVDCANDLARLGDRWPKPPAEWFRGDDQKAEAYHGAAEVVIWTPGREKGNPIVLEPLPDLAAVADDPDDLEQAIMMAREALRVVVAPGKSAADHNKVGVLSAALEYFAKHGGGKLSKFVRVLEDLPADAGGGITNAQKLAGQMADRLKAETQTNILLKQSGSAMDPGILFGIGNPLGRTRISVLNLIGLPELPNQQQFLNQLAMTLFTWIKKNPPSTGKAVRGLLVIDEAKDFVPALGSTACKASLNRLTAQARKYGLGMILATQAPKSMDHNLVANCTTQFYGRANSPAAIDVIREQIALRGGGGHDISTLQPGEFYVHSETFTGEAPAAPIKAVTPMCLSHHPKHPLSETEVLKRARGSRP